MAEFPALPLFTDAFIADTVHLNAAQTGAYIMLLMCAWRTSDCSLPDDDTTLSRFARMDKRAWKANKEIIMQFWNRNDVGRWQQKRLLDERNYVEDKRNKNAAAGKASALKRKKRHLTNVPTESQHKPNQPTPTPTPTVLKEKNKKENFETWYANYPHKVGKAAAEKAFDQAIKKTTLQELITGLESYKKSKPPDRAWCNPATWLNQERWKDEPDYTTAEKENRNGYEYGKASQNVIQRLQHAEERAGDTDGRAMLCDSEHLRKNAAAIGSFDDGDG